LKPADPKPAVLTDAQFHDRAVVASLKLGSADASRHRDTVIPRPRGRGLIEAISPDCIEILSD